MVKGGREGWGKRQATGTNCKERRNNPEQSRECEDDDDIEERWSKKERVAGERERGKL